MDFLIQLHAPSRRFQLCSITLIGPARPAPMHSDPFFPHHSGFLSGAAGAGDEVVQVRPSNVS